MAFLAVALPIASAVMSMVGNYQSAKYNAAVAQNNQQMAETYATQATAKGEVVAAQKEQQTAQAVGGVRAAAGAAGLDLSSGSPLRLQEDTARLGSVDAATIRSNAAQQAYGYRVQGAGFGAQADLYDSRANQSLVSGSLNIFKSMIGGSSTTSGGGSVSDGQV